MIKLYGFPLSNYFNMVKVVLLEKGIDFEVVETMPSQEDDYLSKSPMGKVPCIEVDGKFLSESIPILEYLEELPDTRSFLPDDTFQRAKVRELAQAIELNVELVARRGLAAAFGRDVSDDVKKGMKRDLFVGKLRFGDLSELYCHTVMIPDNFFDFFQFFPGRVKCGIIVKGPLKCFPRFERTSRSKFYKTF